MPDLPKVEFSVRGDSPFLIYSSSESNDRATPLKRTASQMELLQNAEPELKEKVREFIQSIFSTYDSQFCSTPTEVISPSSSPSPSPPKNSPTEELIQPNTVSCSLELISHVFKESLGASTGISKPTVQGSHSLPARSGRSDALLLEPIKNLSWSEQHSSKHGHQKFSKNTRDFRLEIFRDSYKEIHNIRITTKSASNFLNRSQDTQLGEKLKKLVEKTWHEVETEHHEKIETFLQEKSETERQNQAFEMKERTEKEAELIKENEKLRKILLTLGSRPSAHTATPPQKVPSTFHLQDKRSSFGSSTVNKRSLSEPNTKSSSTDLTDNHSFCVFPFPWDDEKKGN